LAGVYGGVHHGLSFLDWPPPWPLSFLAWHLLRLTTQFGHQSFHVLAVHTHFWHQLSHVSD
jgi:hypothetical protein